MQSKVFISAPISIDWSTVQCFEKVIKRKNLKVAYWERWSTYSNSDLDSSDAVVFLLPKNKFEATNQELPIGLKAELSRAYAQSKKIYVGYETSSGCYNIYNANTDGKWIKAQSGTANDMYGELEKLRSAKKVVQNSRYGALEYPDYSDHHLDIHIHRGSTSRIGCVGPIGHQGTQGVAGIEFDERLLLMA